MASSRGKVRSTYWIICAVKEEQASNHAGPARGETFPAFFIFFSSLFSLRDLVAFFFPSFLVSLAFDMTLPPCVRGNTMRLSPYDFSSLKIFCAVAPAPGFCRDRGAGVHKISSFPASAGRTEKGSDCVIAS